MTAADTDDERGLVEAAQADPARFLDLYDRYFTRIYAYAVTRTLDRAEAEDLTSEVFRLALANLGRYEWRGAPFGAWLFRIAANELSDRRARTERARREAAEAPQPGVVEDAIEQRAWLYDLVGRLPHEQRRVVELRFGEDKSVRDVASAIGKSEGAVKQLQRRALETLRAHLGDSRG